MTSGEKAAIRSTATPEAIQFWVVSLSVGEVRLTTTSQSRPGHITGTPPFSEAGIVSAALVSTFPPRLRFVAGDTGRYFSYLLREEAKGTWGSDSFATTQRLFCDY
jgi:hypothetical protein